MGWETQSEDLKGPLLPYHLMKALLWSAGPKCLTTTENSFSDLGKKLTPHSECSHPAQGSYMSCCTQQGADRARGPGSSYTERGGKTARAKLAENYH